MGPIAPCTIETDRLILRPYERGDADAFVALVCDPVVNRFVGGGPDEPQPAREMFGRIFGIYDAHTWGIWAITERASGQLIGSAEIKPRREGPYEGDWEIVFIFVASAWGRGYGTEVARRLVDFGFQVLGVPRVIATVDYENAASIHVLTKAGMAFWAEERDELGPYALYGVGAQRSGS